LLTLFRAGLMFGADKRIISPPGTTPGGNYSQGILVDGTLYISGQGGEDSAGKDPQRFRCRSEAESRKRWAILKSAGMTSADVVSVQVYLVEAAKLNSVCTGYFKDSRPTRTTVVVSHLVGPGNVEVTVTARR
jgi:enamine deaminase RidA (YjgF/YER057c/UK114 family)